MLNDTDPWPVMCTYSREVMLRESGRLRQTTEIICSRCGSQFTFDSQTFDRAVDQHKNNLRTAQRITGFLTKKP